MSGPSSSVELGAIAPRLTVPATTVPTPGRNAGKQAGRRERVREAERVGQGREAQQPREGHSREQACKKLRMRRGAAAPHLAQRRSRL